MKRFAKWTIITLVAFTILGLFAQNGEEEPVETSVCLDAMQAAAQVGEMQDTVSDLYPALQACATLDEWSDASAAHPDALDGADPEIFAMNACRSAPIEVQQAALCSTLNE